MIKQVQEMQKKLEEAQKKFVGTEVQGISGGGKVSVIVVVVKIGKYRVKKVNIDEELKNEEMEVIADLVIAACNDALKKLEEESDKFGGAAAGCLPPGLNLPF
ncbi:nucleoid-associated protein, YbaB/EbfC family [Wolbachia pipientis]|uniref:Nucleoid-associated protein BIY23_02000 n=2 Tax=Wolbachia pipientis TaxID=955 RepID=A0A1E7QKU0_WOLPI|nr:nucleoid-associated protein, YbaB/EbfC family [Wolbachia pipientis]